MSDRFGPLVSGEWLADHHDEVRIVDVRWYLDGRSGREAYLGGHLPGAIWLDIDTELSDPATTADGRHPLPSPQRFARALGLAGIAAGTPVVAYDDTGGSTAARLWWLLHVLGEPAAVLDGGMAAWPGNLTTDVPTPETTERSPQPWPSTRFRAADELDGAVLLDARAALRWAEGDPAIDPRPGHIPGALSAPWADTLGPDGRLRPVDQLRAQLPDVGPVVAYCGSGVTACLDLLALEVAGITDTALYPGSFSQWGADPTREVETG